MNKVGEIFKKVQACMRMHHEELATSLEAEGLLPKGWTVFGAILWNEDDIPCSASVLHWRSIKGGGSYAEAKIRSLLLRPDAYTTDVTLDEYRQMISLCTEPVPNDVTKYADLAPLSAEERDHFLQQLSGFTTLEEVGRDISDLIRDRIGISPFGGGIKLPCILVYDGHRYEFDFLLGMSGAKEAMDDLLFGLMFFKSYLITEWTNDEVCVEVDHKRLNGALSWLQEHNLEAHWMIRLLASW